MFALSDEGQKFVKDEMKKYETTRSAILPALHRVQKEIGWVSPESVAYLSKFMNLPEAWINEVNYFYTMYNKTPVGKNHVQVCATISCAMAGGRELARHLCQTFGVKEGEVSKDGKVTVTKVECLGSCGTAPMMQIGDKYYENLTPDKAVQIIKGMS
jgi:NADH-quinone oxidoreductase subunit E